MKTKTLAKIMKAGLLLAVLVFATGCSKKGVSSEKLREQMNAFLAASMADGSLAELEDSWFTVDAEKKTLDYSVLTGENGTIVFGTVVTKPFSCKSGDSSFMLDAAASSSEKPPHGTRSVKWREYVTFCRLCPGGFPKFLFCGKIAADAGKHQQGQQQMFCGLR